MTNAGQNPGPATEHERIPAAAPASPADAPPLAATPTTPADPATTRPGAATIAIATWGVCGVLLLLAQALWKLTPLALEPLMVGPLSTGQALIYAGWVFFCGYAEGYRGFQKSFSPRVVFRALHLGRNPRVLHVLLAPVFCMSLFHARRRRKVVSWCILIGVTALVVTMHYIPQPWRGIIDGGVVLGLLWGAIAIVIFFGRGLAGEPVQAENDLPPSESASS